MKVNESPLDRSIRAIVAASALSLAAQGKKEPTAVRAGLVAVGAIAGVTAAVGVCPLYKLVGVNTCKA